MSVGGDRNFFSLSPQSLSPDDNNVFVKASKVGRLKYACRGGSVWKESNMNV